MSSVELTDLCQEVIDQVNNELGSLLKEYGFQLIHQEDAKLGERCLFVLESPDCRLRVLSEFGGVGLEIGTLDASTGWASAPAGQWEWFGVASVIEFIHGRKPTLAEISQMGKALNSMSTEEQLQDLAGRLRPVAGEVFGLLRMDAPPERRRAFEAFLSR
jgi:hypothetical protein